MMLILHHCLVASSYALLASSSSIGYYVLLYMYVLYHEQLRSYSRTPAKKLKAAVGADGRGVT
jgi:hypothetical protein